MPKKHVNPASLFPGVQHRFSQVVVASGAKTVFVSGQTAWDADKRIVGRNSGEQAEQALRNVKAAVESAGGSLADIVALRIYMVHGQQNVEPRPCWSESTPQSRPNRRWQPNGRWRVEMPESDAFAGQPRTSGPLLGWGYR